MLIHIIALLVAMIHGGSSTPIAATSHVVNPFDSPSSGAKAADSPSSGAKTVKVADSPSSGAKRSGS